MQLPARSQKEPADSLVRLMKAKSLELLEKDGINYRKAIDATFLHNGTYLISDTALWNVDNKIINAWGHVQVIQEETILTSDKLDYLVDENTAQFRGSVVQLKNKQDNILRTRFLDYNTSDSIAVFREGASMRDADGQIIESYDGTYDSSQKVFHFFTNVNMFTDSVFVKTEDLDYISESSMAFFNTDIDFWKDGNMMSASGGWYNRAKETFFFRDNVHGMSQKQEAWCDTMYVYRGTGDLHLIGNAQIQDTTRSVTAVARSIYYSDTTSTITMTDEAAVAMETKEQSKVDTVYFGADTLIYYTVYKCDIGEGLKAAAKTRLEGLNTDAVDTYRNAAAKAAAEARAAEEKADMENSGPGFKGGKKPSLDSPQAFEQEEAPVEEAPPVEETDESSDSLKTAEAPKPVIDSSKVGFAVGIGNVKAFRADLQLNCGKMNYCDLDSIARLYINPLVWNDGNRQYSADSIYVLISNGRADRASLQSNAFIITREDSLCFDQIKSTEVMAYFDSTSALRRFDALGGATAMFYLQENDRFATVNKVECKMLTADFIGGELNRVHFFEQPKNDAYPIVQLPESEKKMKGFNWMPKLRPDGKKDITSLEVRPSERRRYEAHPRALFPHTKHYFPGYLDKIYADIARRDSLSKIPKPKTAHLDTATAVSADSLGRPADSLVVADQSVTVGAGEAEGTAASIPADTLAGEAFPTDSLARVGAPSDTVAPVVAPAPALQAVTDTIPTKAELKAKARAERKARSEERRRLNTERREARWAELDRRDAEKLAAKEQKKLARSRARTLLLLKAKLRREAKEDAKLRKYIERYEKQKAKHERKHQSDSSRELPQGVETGGNLLSAPPLRPETVGSDSLFRHDGPVDDRDLLGGSRISGVESRTSL